MGLTGRPGHFGERVRTPTVLQNVSIGMLVIMAVRLHECHLSVCLSVYPKREPGVRGPAGIPGKSGPPVSTLY